MNREILFRGRCAETGRWVYGDLVQGDNFAAIVKYEPRVGIVRFIAEVDPKTVGQYTGLKDRKGDRIFGR